MIDFLAQRTWWELHLTAQAHALPFNTRQTRQQALAGLRRRLLDEQGLKRALKRLEASQRQALLALRDAGGCIPQADFCARFGHIRPYRPWKATTEAEAFPWKQPVSIAERL